MILHLFGWDRKFVIPFLDFVDQNFDTKDHRFIVHRAQAKNDLPERGNIYPCPHIMKRFFFVMNEIRMAEKVIIHGLFSLHLLLILMLQPRALTKCYWSIWGADLYSYVSKKKDIKWAIDISLKKLIVPKIGHFITHIKGDYELAQEWYGAKGEWHDCFMYPSNLFKDYQLAPKPHEGINILLGNSATPSNNHMDALERLRPFAGQRIKIYCPLSYGDDAYADEVERAGQEVFGDKFIALREFLSFENYLELLSSIDVAIFNHDRQQAVGNIVSLLGFGKKVYIRSDVTTWNFMNAIGVAIFDAKDFNDFGSALEGEWSRKNIDLIKNYFSNNNLIRGWRSIFGDKHALFES